MGKTCRGGGTTDGANRQHVAAVNVTQFTE